MATRSTSLELRNTVNGRHIAHHHLRVKKGLELQIQSCFSATYREAREKFLNACAAASLSIDSRLNPVAKGAQGEALYTDIVRIGAADASKLLVLMSGTHGVEGYCGSGVQIGLLRSDYFNRLPEDLSVVMVHALNPYGFSHDRRVNEDNVDLNRNFLDFRAPDRPGRGYAEIHDHILPEDWDGPGREIADQQLAAFIETRGLPAFQAAVSSGQYAFPDGVFYGGQAPTWSNTMFRSVISDYFSNAKAAGFIDFHTGLGPFGYGELIAIGSESQKARAAHWYGAQVTDPEAGTSTSAPLDGMVAHGIAEALTDTKIAFTTLEYGTRDINQVLTALRGDNWLYHKGDFKTELATRIKRDIRDAFYPDDDAWRASVWARAVEVTNLALQGLIKTTLS